MTEKVTKHMQGSYVCIWDSKKDKYRTHITMGGNLVNFPGDCGTPTADLLTVKLLLNSIISTPNANSRLLTLKIST